MPCGRIGTWPGAPQRWHLGMPQPMHSAPSGWSRDSPVIRPHLAQRTIMI